MTWILFGHLLCFLPSSLLLLAPDRFGVPYFPLPPTLLPAATLLLVWVGFVADNRGAGLGVGERRRTRKTTLSDGFDRTVLLTIPSCRTCCSV